MSYTTKANARRAALKQFGRTDAQEGIDFEIIGSGHCWDFLPGSKYDREPGYYWVTSDEEGWTVAEWNGKFWHVINGQRPYSDDFFTSISARIPQAAPLAAGVEQQPVDEPGREPIEVKAWHELVEKDDRNSPEEYPDMCLISFNELADFMQRAAKATAAPLGAQQQPGAFEPIGWVMRHQESGQIAYRSIVPLDDAEVVNWAATFSTNFRLEKAYRAVDAAPLGALPGREEITLQARPADGGEWINIFPSQLEWMAKEGHSVRAIELRMPGEVDRSPVSADGPPNEVTPPAPSTVHYLKTWPRYFDDVRSGRKSFEWRVDDRSFAVGDTLVLQEWRPKRENLECKEGQYTGREIRRVVSYAFSPFATNKRTVIMALTPPTPGADSGGEA